MVRNCRNDIQQTSTWAVDPLMDSLARLGYAVDEASVAPLRAFLDRIQLLGDPSNSSLPALPDGNRRVPANFATTTPVPFEVMRPIFESTAARFLLDRAGHHRRALSAGRIDDHFRRQVKGPRSCPAEGWPIGGKGRTWTRWFRGSLPYVALGRNHHRYEVRPGDLGGDEADHHFLDDSARSAEQGIFAKQMIGNLFLFGATLQRIAAQVVPVGLLDGQIFLDAAWRHWLRLSEHGHAHLLLDDARRLGDDFLVLEEDLRDFDTLSERRAILRAALLHLPREQVATLAGCRLTTFDTDCHHGRPKVRARIEAWPFLPSPGFVSLFVNRRNQPRRRGPPADCRAPGSGELQ